jgi:hypothetical protein
MRKGLAAFFSHQRGRVCQDFFEPLAAALLALRAASIKISGNRDAGEAFRLRRAYYAALVAIKSVVSEDIEP